MLREHLITFEFPSGAVCRKVLSRQGQEKILEQKHKKRLILKELWLEPLIFDPLESRTGADPCVSQHLEQGQAQSQA